MTAEHASWLNGGHVVFGVVLQGFELVQQIERLQTTKDGKDRPVNMVRIADSEVAKLPSPTFFDTTTDICRPDDVEKFKSNYATYKMPKNSKAV